MEKLIKSRFWIFGLLILILEVLPAFTQAQGFGSEDELKKNAADLFQEESFKKALPLYSQLVSLYPSDPEYNYKYGTCLLYGDADKSKSLSYLKFASTKAGVSNLCYYYYARSLHLNYQFNDAIRYYEKFKSTASSKEQKERPVDRFIEMCKNGNNLLRDPNDVAVIGKQEIKRSDFFRAYNLDEIGGKIIVKPEEFKTKYDLKVNEYSIIHLPTNPTVLYFSSYGDNGNAGKDIYRVRKLEGGEWSEPENLGSPVNTPYDEDFPFFHSDKNQLYFSSKGHNSMGGYDIFRTTFNESTGTWSKPVNMDFAISSSDDDILFISDIANEIAYFASSRSSLNDYISVYKVLISKRPIELSVVKGKFISEADPNMRTAKITVMDPINEEELGVFNTDPNTGDYTIKLPTNGGVVKFILETTDDAPIHTGKVTLPQLDQLQALKQELRLVGEGANQKLVIKNLFDKENAEPIDAELIADFIRNKSKLEVNTDENQVNDLIANRRGGEGPELVIKEEGELEPSSKSPTADLSDLSNQDLINEVQRAVNELEVEITLRNLQSDYMHRYTFNTARKADDLFSLNEDILDDISTSDEASRSELENKLFENKKRANPLASEAIAGYGLAGGIKNEVKEKKLELRSLKESLAVLKSKVNAGNRSEAETIYTEAMDKIATVNEMSSALEITPSRLKEQYQQQKEKAEKVASYLTDLQQEQKDLENEIARNKKEAENLKGKKQEAMLNQIAAFEIDLEDIAFETESVAEKARKEQNDASMLKQELDITATLVNKVKKNQEKAKSLTPEESLELESLVAYFKEQNLLDDILGSEEMSSIAINQKMEEKGKNANYHPPYDASGKPVDYDAIYEAELQAAASIEDPAQQKAAKEEIYNNWNNTINEDLRKKKSQLVSVEDAKTKKALESEIAALNNSKTKKSEALLALNSTPIKQQSYPDVSESTDVSYSAEEFVKSGKALSPIDKEGNNIDYNTIYQSRLSELNQESTGPALSQNIAEVNELWAETIQSDINSKQSSLRQTKKEEEKQKLLAEIQSLEVARAQKEEAAMTALSSAEVATKSEDKAETAQFQEKETAGNKVDFEQQEIFEKLSLNPRNIKGDNGEIVNYTLAYTSAFNQAVQEGKEEEATKIIDDWKLSNAEEIELIKKELKRLQRGKERDQKIKELAALEALKEELDSTPVKTVGFRIVNGRRVFYNLLDEDPQNIEQDGKVADYDSYYDKQLELADKEKDKELIAAIEANRKKSRKRHIEILSEKAENEKDAVTKEELLAIMAALKELNAAAETEKEAPAIAAASIDENEAEVIEPYDENGQEVDYKALYADQLAEAYKLVNGYERKATEAEISKNQLTTIEMDLEAKKKEREETRKRKDQKELDQMIAELQAYYDNQKEIDNKIQAELAELGPEKEQYERAQLLENEKLSIKYPLIDYESEESNQNMVAAGEMIQDILKMEGEISQKEQALNKEEGTVQREKISSEIQELKKSSSDRQLELAKVLQLANSSEFKEMETRAKQLSSNSSAVNKAKADELMAQSVVKFQNAQQLRRQAATTADFKKKSELIAEAFKLETEAIRMRKDAIVTYEGEGAELAAVEDKANQKDATKEVKTDKGGNEVKERPVEPEKKAVEPLELSKKEVDEIESNEVYLKYVEKQKEADRLYKSAEVEYAKSADFEKEAEKLEEQARLKKEESENLRKKKERKAAAAEAIRLEALAVANRKKADSTATNAEGLQNDAKAKNSDALLTLKEVGNDDNFEKMLAYYEAKLAEVLKVREEPSTFASANESSNGGNRQASDLENLPLATELSAEEFRKLDFRSIQAKVEKELFIKSEGSNISAYNSSKPIPIDEEAKLPEGILFKVQIGAFRNPIPQDLFKGFAPVSGERIPSGITRYTAGIFKSFATADEAKRQIRNLGYNDAFVVAFRNGERIPISEAMAALGETASATNNNTGINIPDAQRTAENTQNTTGVNQNNASITNRETANQDITRQAPDVKNTLGLFYTVQVGVYANTKIPAQLESIRPLNSEKTSRNYVRYTSGRFSSFEQAVEWRKQMVSRGVTDAFVTAYLNGNRISVGEARNYNP